MDAEPDPPEPGVEVGLRGAQGGEVLDAEVQLAAVGGHADHLRRDVGVADAARPDGVEPAEHGAHPLRREAEVVARVAVDPEEHHRGGDADPARADHAGELAPGGRRVLAVLEGVEAERRSHFPLAVGQRPQVLHAVDAGPLADVRAGVGPPGEQRPQVAVLGGLDLQRAELDDRVGQRDARGELGDERADQRLGHGGGDVSHDVRRGRPRSRDTRRSHPARAHRPGDPHQRRLRARPQRAHARPRLPARGLPHPGGLRPVGDPRGHPRHDRLAQAGGDRRPVHPAGRARPGARVPGRLLARARREPRDGRAARRAAAGDRARLRPRRPDPPGPRDHRGPPRRRVPGAAVDPLPPDGVPAPAAHPVGRPDREPRRRPRAGDRRRGLLVARVGALRRRLGRGGGGGLALPLPDRLGVGLERPARLRELLLAAAGGRRRRARHRPVRGALHGGGARRRGGRRHHPRDPGLPVHRPRRRDDHRRALPGDLLGEGAHGAPLRVLREVQPARADVGDAVRRRPRALRLRSRDLRDRRALAAGGDRAAGLRADGGAQPRRLQLGRVLPGARRDAADGGRRRRERRHLPGGRRAGRLPLRAAGGRGGRRGAGRRQRRRARDLPRAAVRSQPPRVPGAAGGGARDPGRGGGPRAAAARVRRALRLARGRRARAVRGALRRDDLAARGAAAARGGGLPAPPARGGRGVASAAPVTMVAGSWRR
ncbi:MAG: hypothetical protein AVDCRST_MAG30-872 [uncultured Solirubrobacteraceae bacterium]|uniref:Uncharacterized protein n=1 Tax=uncultured Solirubrobacteraceae bacterium TaxID=1162706 RepID=A0A6J4RVQ2_9ACTN|nr:MAG: hypothetical protein AVDCRST_MAG30-872 [uncultured Solirubrobacteraceae bacterium]